MRTQSVQDGIPTQSVGTRVPVSNSGENRSGDGKKPQRIWISRFREDPNNLRIKSYLFPTGSPGHRPPGERLDLVLIKLVRRRGGTGAVAKTTVLKQPAKRGPEAARRRLGTAGFLGAASCL